MAQMKGYKLKPNLNYYVSKNFYMAEVEILLLPASVNGGSP